MKAYGVHFLERDVSVAEARRLLFKGLIGRSVHFVEAVWEVEEQSVDYVVFGFVFPTVIHFEAVLVGLDALREVVEAVKILVLAIGGVEPALEESCWKAGVVGFAAIVYFLAR